VNFDPTDTHGNHLLLALCALEPGKSAPEQSPSVRRELLALERAELAEYDWKREVWRLTAAGKRRAKAFAAACRKASRPARRSGGASR
jgi:hypothetical protein